MALAGSLELALYADVARLRKDMEDAKRIVSDGAQSMARAVETAKNVLGGLASGLAGFAVINAFASHIKGAVDLADQMNKLSQRTGVATEQLSQLRFAAKLADVSNESLTTGLKKLNQAIAEAAGGDKAFGEVFKNLGINVREANGQVITADKALSMIAGRFSQASDGAVKTAYSVKLMGKAGDELIPLLNGGSRALQEMMQKADRLGLTISTDFARRAEEFNDNLTILKASGDRLAVTMGDELVRALGSSAKAMADASEQGGKLKGIIAGINEFGNKFLDWEGNAQRKGIAWQREKLAEAKKELDRISAIWNSLSSMQKSAAPDIAAGVEEATQKYLRLLNTLQELLNTYYKLDGSAGAGRGTARDPRQLGPIPSIDQQVRELKPLTGGGGGGGGASGTPVNQSAIDAAKEYADTFKALLKIEADLEAKTNDLSKAQALLVEYLTSPAYLQHNEEMRQVLLQKAYSVIATEQQTAAEKELQKTLAESAKAFESLHAAERQAEGGIQSQIDQLKAEAEGYGLLASQVAQLTLVRLEDMRAVAASGGEDLEHIDRLIAKQRELIGLLQGKETRDANAKAAEDILREHNRIWESIDQTAHDVFVNIFEGGSNAFKKLGQTLKAALLDMLYQMTIKKWIINIQASMSGQSQGGGFDLSSVFGGGGSSGGNPFNGTGPLMSFQNGGGGFNIPGLGINTAQLGQLAAIYAGGSAVASMLGSAMGLSQNQMKVASTSGGFLGGIPGALIGKFSHPGGPKQDGWTGVGVEQGGDNSLLGAVQPMVAAAQAQFDQINALLGGTNSAQFGLRVSRDPEGDSPSFVSSGAFVNGQFVRQTIDTNVGRDDADVQAAIDRQMKEALLAALKHTNLPAELGRYLSTVTVEEVDKALVRVKKALGEKQSLEEQIFLLTHTEQEILTRNRRAELDALDETNRALGERVQILQDEKVAAATLSDALQRASDSSKAFQSFIFDFNRDIRGYIDGLNSTPQGGGSLESQKNAAFEAFTRQLGLARSGDRSALQGITGYADQLIAAQTAYTATSTPTQDIIALVKRELSSLPQMMSDAEYIAKAISDASAAQIAAGKTSVLDLGSLLSGKFATLDTSVNGLLDFAEVKAALGPIASDATIRAFMLQADLDADGQLSKLELLRTATSQAVLDLGTLLSGKFTTLDTSLNGLLSFEELRAAVGPLASDATLRAFMLQADTDGDGQISRLEAIAAATGTLQTRVTDSITLVREALKGQSDLLFERFGVLDLSVDGLLTFDEVKLALGGVASDATLHAMIERIDANGDGQISKLEALNTSLLGGLFGSAGLIVDKFFDLDQDLSSLLDFSELKLAIGPLASDDTIRALIALVDSNGDQQISRQEATIAAIRETRNATTTPPTTTTPPPTTATPPPTLPEGFAAQLKTFIASGFAEMVGGGDSGPNLVVGPYSSFEQLTQSMSGSGLLSGLTPEQQTLALGEASALFNRYRTVGAFADGGFASGLSLVGERGPELVDFRTPGRVYTAQQTQGMFAGGGKVEALLQQNNALQQQNNALMQRLLEVEAAGHRGARAQGEEIVQNTRAMSNAAKLAAAKPVAVGA